MCPFFYIQTNYIIFIIYYMVILKESTEKQQIKIIPRSFPDEISVVIRRKESNVSTTIGSYDSGYTYYYRVTNDSGSYEQNNLMFDLGYYLYSSGYMIIQDVFTLKENSFYTLQVKDGSSIIYRANIFCTNQTDYNTFDVNSGEYTTEDSYDNDFVIL